MGEVCKERKKKHAAFPFLEVAKEEILGNILNLDVSKACQDTDFPSKIIKENQTSLPAFYTIVLIHMLLTQNFH